VRPGREEGVRRDAGGGRKEEKIVLRPGGRQALIRLAVTAVSALLLTSWLSGCAFLRVSLTEEVQPLAEKALSGRGKDKVLLIDITGILMSGESAPRLGEKKKPPLLARVREELDRARRDERIRAVVVRINSPGGGVTASDTLYHELKSFRQQTGAAVVAHIMDVGTSGAYYAALAADRIFSQPTSVTGSIGVVMYRFDATGLMQKIGIGSQEISSAEHKAMGSPFRQLSADERRIYQDVINSLHDRFVSLVAESRKTPVEAVRRLADGRIYTSEEARASGLIDGIGYLEDAVEQAKALAGLSEATLVTYFRPGDYRGSIYSIGLINIDMAGMTEPGFLYLWWP
jgi:protease-4